MNRFINRKRFKTGVQILNCEFVVRLNLRMCKKLLFKEEMVVKLCDVYW